MPFFTQKNKRIYYEIHGQGQPLLLIAGLASDSQSWMTVLKELAQNFKVIIFDNQGVGRTTPMDQAASIQDMAMDCHCLLEHLNINQAIILGHSMGGFIAQEFAYKYPGQTQKLILEATAPKNLQRNNLIFSDWLAYLQDDMTLNLWFKNIFYWILSPAFFADKQAVQAAVDFSVSYPYPQSRQAFQNQIQAILEFDSSSKLDKISVPTLIIQGEQDLLFPPSQAAKLSLIPDSRTYIMPGCAHSIHIENPQGFISCVRDFIHEPIK